MSTDTDRHLDVPAPPQTNGAHESLSARSFGWLSSLCMRFGLADPNTLRETIEAALKEGPGASTAFSAEERAMLRRLLRFGQSRVEDIMVPRADIIAVDENESIQDLLTTFEEAGVSRVPVFSTTLDDPHGMIHIKDLFRWLLEDAASKGRSNGHAKNASAPKASTKKSVKKRNGNGVHASNETENHEPDRKTNTPVLELAAVDLSRPVSIAKIKRPLLFVPPSMPAMNLLIRMQSTRNHMALVIDEYGGTDGLVTIEDLVEQIVGDIEDEHDDAEIAHIFHDPVQGLLASARTPLEELENHLHCKLLNAEQEEEIDTLGGLVFALVGRVPSRGEIVRHPLGIEFEVLDADPRRIKSLKVHMPQTLERSDETEPKASSEDHQ